ncbi:MAG: 50S ribosomal protein L29 [Phycisphaerae bacterium]|jgi:large subunit ribosomal protein L29|nr:50S ribosomal protein L29 [Phycisphaerae bacterium]HAW96075.1 50S ribosomal protein L29 [Phycisphaerales bacterium]|tara:strand:- start:3211 stop:3432 length:222 start_codon:yes stop_codon:yes gene_type:complete
MKAKEVHNFNDEEVDIEIVRLKKRLFELRCQKVTDKIEDTSQFKKVRRDIARLHTERRSREIAKATANSEATS